MEGVEALEGVGDLEGVEEAEVECLEAAMSPVFRMFSRGESPTLSARLPSLTTGETAKFCSTKHCSRRGKCSLSRMEILKSVLSDLKWFFPH